MLQIPLVMTTSHQKTHGNPPSKALIHPATSSTMSTQPQHTCLGLLDIKITLDCHLNTSNHSMTPMLTSHQKPQKRQWDGPIYLPKSTYVLMNEESNEALKKYNLEALQKLKNRTVQEALCCHDDPTPNPGAEQEDQPLQINTDHDLETSNGFMLDLINNQAPSDEQLEQALQTYQALTS